MILPPHKTSIHQDQIKRFSDKVRREAKGWTCGDCKYKVHGLCVATGISIYYDWAVACSKFETSEGTPLALLDTKPGSVQRPTRPSTPLSPANQPGVTPESKNASKDVLSRSSTALCPVCNCKIYLRKSDRRLGKHSSKKVPGAGMCPGSYKDPA